MFDRPLRRVGGGALIGGLLLVAACQNQAEQASEPPGLPATDESARVILADRPANPEQILLDEGSGAPDDSAPGATPCRPVDPVLAASAFVVVTSPPPGARAPSPVAVAGCSRTFERTITWRLLARDGSELAAGHAQGGGVDGPADFSFTVSYAVDRAQVGMLEVTEPDASGGEGYPPVRTVLPLVLLPPADGP